MKKPFHMTIAALASATLLVGCSNADGNKEHASNETVGQAESQTDQEAEPTFDTGSYNAEPHKGWPSLPDDVGPASEIARITDNTLLPYEVDKDFSKGTGAERQYNLDGLALFLHESMSAKLEPFAANYVHGFMRTATTENGDKEVGHYVLRFTDAETAQQAATDVMAGYLESGDNFLALKPTNDGGTEEQLAGHAQAKAVRSTDGQLLSAAVAHNEYVVLAYAGNAEDSQSASPQEAEWQTGYLDQLITMQIPLLDTIPTKKTEAGYGMSDDWPALDPDDILKYTLLGPKDDSLPSMGRLPASVTPRAMAGQYEGVSAMLTAIDQAGVEAMADSEFKLFRAKNPESAELLLATMRAFNADGEVKKWDEPQGVPGAECGTKFNSSVGKTHFCHLTYENYFATAEIFEGDEREDEVGGETTEAPAVDPKKQLSQAVAAQYLILQQAPTSGSK
ncbi:DUF7373 family lipoprotein [Corynebacterium sp. 20_84]